MSKKLLTTKVNFRGMERLQQRFRESPKKVIRATRQALFAIANNVMTKSKPLVPVDTSALRNSGHVQLPSLGVGGEVITIKMGYGGPAGAGQNNEDVEYAVKVHEDLEARHTVGQAKYLEIPFNEIKPTIANEIAARILENLR